ncbi:MAG: hypothetical protein PHF35_04735 [Candidatus Moranbacteria bacterium]|nr:hypothetical protein [Candidatus Moranbacteria bacterium]
MQEEYAVKKIASERATAPEQKGQVTKELEDLFTMVDVTEKRLAFLRERIAPALNTDLGDKSISEKNPSECLCPLAEQIRVVRERIGYLNIEMKDIADRIQL